MTYPVRLAVDIGGTFTDIVLEIAGERALHAQGADDAARARGRRARRHARRARARPASASRDLDVFIHGTTLATNALIERKGARTALITTEGFRDVVEIADESRYDQYDVFIDKPRRWCRARLRFTVPERIDAHGDVLPAARRGRGARAVARAARGDGVEASPSASCTCLRQPGARASARARSCAEALPGARGHAVLARSARRCANTSASRPPSPTPTCSR